MLYHDDTVIAFIAPLHTMLYKYRMSQLTPKIERELANRAKSHYSYELPYHNWVHARDVMSAVADLADRSTNPEISAYRHLLVIAAAWHDADYHVKEMGAFNTKEERSAELAGRLLPELTESDRALLLSGIIDTTVAKVPKDNLFGEVLHVADVGYLAAPTTHFMGRLALMRREWGSPDWGVTTERTLAFGQTVITDAQELMPKVLSRTDAAMWIAQIRINLVHLSDEFSSGRLSDYA